MLEHSEDDAEFRPQPAKTRRIHMRHLISPGCTGARLAQTERNRYYFKWLISTLKSSIRACLFAKWSWRTLKMADGGQKADLCWCNTAQCGFVRGFPNTSYESFIFGSWITFKCVKGGELISKSGSLWKPKGYCGKQNGFSGNFRYIKCSWRALPCPRCSVATCHNPEAAHEWVPLFSDVGLRMRDMS